MCHSIFGLKFQKLSLSVLRNLKNASNTINQNQIFFINFFKKIGVSYNHPQFLPSATTIWPLRVVGHPDGTASNPKWLKGWLHPHIFVLFSIFQLFIYLFNIGAIKVAFIISIKENKDY
jgi:hypothetical protein